MNRFVFKVSKWMGAATKRAVAYESCSDEDYVRMAYVVLLQRPIDASGLYAWRTHITSGRFTRTSVVNTILQSDEYIARFGVDIIGIMHRSRQMWIRTIPAFDEVLDIGGSSPTMPEGALIQHGYPHRPSRIDILDLPPDQQYWGAPKYAQNEPLSFSWGTVSYHHGRAEDIGNIPALQGRRYDGVFLGQAIEHIYPQALPAMLRWIDAHLKPNGTLVFDTPNRLLTKIQCPGSLTDPDHKYEYTPGEMEAVLADAGFRVTRRLGLVHLPVQAATGVYDPREFGGAQAMSEHIDACFLFALEAQPERVA
jgi:hypothetical protein